MLLFWHGNLCTSRGVGICILFFGRHMCVHGIKARRDREQQCLLLQAVVPKYSTNSSYSF